LYEKWKVAVKNSILQIKDKIIKKKIDSNKKIIFLTKISVFDKVQFLSLQFFAKISIFYQNISINPHRRFDKSATFSDQRSGIKNFANSRSDKSQIFGIQKFLTPKYIFFIRNNISNSRPTEKRSILKNFRRANSPGCACRTKQVKIFSIFSTFLVFFWFYIFSTASTNALIRIQYSCPNDMPFCNFFCQNFEKNPTKNTTKL